MIDGIHNVVSPDGYCPDTVYKVKSLMNKFRSAAISLLALFSLSCGDMYDSAKKSVLNDLMLVEMPVYYLYTANNIGAGSTVSTFRLNPDGSPVRECEFPIRNPAVSPGPILAHPVYNVLYCAENSQVVSYQLDIFGRFTGTVKSIYAPGATTFNSFCFNTSGGILYAGSITNGAVYGFSLWPDGTAYRSFQQTTADVQSIASHPNGKYLYAGFSGYIRRYIVDQATGSLSFGSDLTVTNNHLGIQVHQSGNFLYDLNNITGLIEFYNIDFNGSPTLRQTYSTATTLSRIVLHPCGRYLIAIGWSGVIDLLIYSIAADGTLIPIHPVGDYFFGSNPAQDIKVHPDGRTIYMTVSDGVANYLYFFHFDPLTGTVDMSNPSFTRIAASGTPTAVSNYMAIGFQGLPLLIDTKRFRK